MKTVAIVGRPNVGKSALFNRLARRRIAIVHDQPGVTRDRIFAECPWAEGEPAAFRLIDTGGIGSDVDASFTEQVEAEVALAMEAADLILFVVDAQAGLNPVDQAIAQKLRRVKKPIILTVNKVDHEKHAELDADFARLGFKSVLSISAEHNRGIGELLAAIRERLPEMEEELATAEPADAPVPPVELAIVGRPNVGKSSLINGILHDRRTLVSPISGTTRDAVDVPYERDGKRYTLIDTAGIRPAGKQGTSVEVFSVMRSERTIRRADLCVLVVDAVDGVTAQDKRIAGLIQEAGKPCLVAVNKWDLLKGGDDERKEILSALLERIRAELFFVDYAPIAVISALKGDGVGRVFTLIEKIRSGAKARINTGALNRLLADAQTAHPAPARGSKRFRIVYATQPERNDPRFTPIPTPSLLLFVNQADLLVPSYRKYLETRIRKEVPWLGLPLKFFFKEREARGRRAHRED